MKHIVAIRDSSVPTFILQEVSDRKIQSILGIDLARDGSSHNDFLRKIPNRRANDLATPQEFDDALAPDDPGTARSSTLRSVVSMRWPRRLPFQRCAV